MPVQKHDSDLFIDTDYYFIVCMCFIVCSRVWTKKSILPSTRSFRVLGRRAISFVQVHLHPCSRRWTCMHICVSGWLCVWPCGCMDQWMRGSLHSWLMHTQGQNWKFLANVLLKNHEKNLCWPCVQMQPCTQLSTHATIHAATMQAVSYDSMHTLTCMAAWMKVYMNGLAS